MQSTGTETTHDHEELREQVKALQNDVDALFNHREQVMQPKIEDQQSTIDDLRGEVNNLEATVQRLEAELDNLAGLADDEQSTPAARVRDVKTLMINAASAKAGDTPEDGTVAWKYGQIVDQLEANGHGRVYAAQAYSVMENLHEHAGFAHVTNQDDEQVLRVSYAALPAADRVNEINNAEGASGRSDTADTAAEHNHT